MRLAILFRRIGPYHRARLEAAGRRGDVWCIEGGGRDTVYAWDTVAAGASFRRLTLFPDADAGQMPARTVQAAVFRALDQTRPAVVAIPGWQDKLALAALRWATAHSVPTIVMSDSNEFDAPRTAAKEWVKRRIVGLCSAGLVSGTTAANYLVKLGMARERIFTGYDVVDNAYFEQNAETLKAETQKEKIRSRFGLPERFFLCVARFIWEKNLPRLLEAYARYRQRAETGNLKPECGRETLKPETLKGEGAGNRNTETPKHRTTAPWHLVLLGDGPLREQLRSQVSSLRLQDHVHLPGFKQYEELPAYYGLASALMLPSISEPWGLVVNEAMASGLPVLVSNRCGCAPDLVREGVNGFTFDPYDVEALADLMLRISAFQDFRLSAFGEAGREIIAAWSPERFAENLRQAARTATTFMASQATRIDRLLLKVLVLRTTTWLPAPQRTCVK